MQKAYLNAVYELAQKDKNVVIMTADNGTDFDKWLQRELTEQYFDMGISECNMVSAAAGMSTCEKIPFIQTAGAFLAYRTFEFIRNDICLQKKNVKIIGTGSGLSISYLGPTHHTTEDIGVLRTLPGLSILSPCSPIEVSKCIDVAYKTEGPVYIRLGMSGEEEIYTSEYEFQAGKCVEISSGKDTAIFVTGSIISEALKAAEMLKKAGISLKVINVHTLKPILSGEIMEYAADMPIVFTLEEHNIYGGLGSIILECLCEEGYQGRVQRLGLKDCFADGYGSLNELRKKNGLDSNAIVEIIKQSFGRMKDLGKNYSKIKMELLSLRGL